ncbi:MAG: response regulator, partial [Planctomycetota bacterium]
MLPDPFDLPKTLDAIPFPTLVLDREGKILHTNESGAAHLGVESAGEARCFAALMGRDRACPDCPLEEVFSTGNPAFLRLDGDEESSGRAHSIYPLLDEKGKTCAALHAVVPGSDPSNTEWALEATEQRYRSLVEHSPLWIVETDKMGNLIYLNPQARKESGYSLEELKGKNVVEFIPEEERQEAIEQLMKGLSGSHNAVKTRLKMADGSIRTFLNNSALIGMESPDPRMIVFAVDVTPQDEAERGLVRQVEIEHRVLEISNLLALEEDSTSGSMVDALKLLGETLDVSRTCIYTLDLEKGIIDRHSEWKAEGVPSSSDSTATLKVDDFPEWGRTLLSREPIHLHDVESIPREASRAREVLATDGTRAALFFPMFSKNEPIGFIGAEDVRGPRAWEESETLLLRLVSEVFTAHLVRRRSEQAEREARESAERADRAKTAFLTNMSHEIRTPLTGIIGMIDLASETDPNPAQREFLSLAKASAETLLGLLGGILDLAKIEAGTFDLDPKPFDVRAVVEETVGRVSLRAREKGLEVAIFVDPRIPVPLTGDGLRLKQILENLVDNAVKFTEMGAVEVHARHESEEGDRVTVGFIVRDTGVGVPEESRDSIFSSFSQADGSSGRRFGGTGLGLAISRQIAEMMGSVIELESEANQGSTFRFSAEFAAPGGSRNRLSGFTRPAARVLVAEGEESTRSVLISQIEAYGLEACGAAGGEETATLVEQGIQDRRPFDMVLIDTRLSSGEGLALAGRLTKAGFPPGKITLMQAGVRTKTDSTRWLAHPEIYSLTKPVRPSALEGLLRRIRVNDSVAPEAASAPAGAEGKQPGFLRILIAEDNLVNRKLISTLLARRGWEAVAVPDGRSALAKLREETFDAVLMDIQMPVMDGMEVTRIIREEEKGTGRHIPIIAVTAHAMTEDRDKCLAGGMDDYIAKPLRAPDLFRVIETWSRPGSLGDSDPMGPPPPIDVIDIRKRLGIELELVFEMLEILLEDAPNHMERIGE